MPMIEANGVKLNVLQMPHPDPSAEHLVMLHGLATNMAFWYLRLAPALNERFHVTLYDLRGHGRSERTPTGYRASSLALDLTALLDRLEIEQSHLIAHSFGGVVALEHATRVPRRVQSLLLADSHIGALCEDSPYNHWGEGEALRTALESRQIDLDVSDPYFGYRLLKVVAEMHLEKTEVPSVLQELVNPLSGALSKRTTQQWFKLLTETEAEEEFTAPDNLSIERLSRLQMPILAIYGSKSPAMYTGEKLLRVWPHAHFRQVLDAGHFFPMTRPDEILVNHAALLSGELDQAARYRQGEEPSNHFRSDRFLLRDGSWYFHTRENTWQGPFSTKRDAGQGLARYLRSVSAA